ncbi:unnamed protein product [Penicillium roqueforti FM164]|uniref:Genomic scaffold, ProqFM164S02 n=1 Tax=Penicillium roqueforti (strain FM164) TaxID=1365484 RepID=W6QCY8_PENRF|nr:unnamed protein product [Penicillium roqueforti FM164]
MSIGWSIVCRWFINIFYIINLRAYRRIGFTPFQENHPYAAGLQICFGPALRARAL